MTCCMKYIFFCPQRGHRSKCVWVQFILRTYCNIEGQCYFKAMSFLSAPQFRCCSVTTQKPERWHICITLFKLSKTRLNRSCYFFVSREVSSIFGIINNMDLTSSTFSSQTVKGLQFVAQGKKVALAGAALSTRKLNCQPILPSKPPNAFACWPRPCFRLPFHGCHFRLSDNSNCQPDFPACFLNLFVLGETVTNIMGKIYTLWLLIELLLTGMTCLVRSYHLEMV